MDILLLTEDFFPSVSGGAHARWRFAEIATNRGHNVSVITPRIPETSASEYIDDIEIVRPFPNHPPSLPPASTISTMTRIVHSGALFAWLQWWARDREFDAVYSASNTLHWVGSAFGRQRKIPSLSFVGYTPSMQSEEQSQFKLALERLNFKYGMGDHVFCRIPSIRESISMQTDADVQLIHGVLNEVRIREAYKTYKKTQLLDTTDVPDRVLVFAGRLSEEKNVPAAIEIISQLPAHYRLLVIGDGPERDAVVNAINKYNVNERVTLCGELSHKETLVRIAGADGLLLTSRTESYGTVVFEGLSLGCAVFTTPVGILPNIKHSRLHVAPVEQLPDRICAASMDQNSFLDEVTLSQYSMERFVDDILNAVDT